MMDTTLGSMTEPQNKKLHTLLADNEFIDHIALEEMIGFSTKELSKQDASELIDALMNGKDIDGVTATISDRHSNQGKLGTDEPPNTSDEQIRQHYEGTPKQPPARQESNVSVPAIKKPMIVGKPEQMAQVYGIPTELANMYFMTIEGALYVKQPGLLYLASKKGYSRILTTSSYDESKHEWSAETSVYPIVSKEVIMSLGNLDKEMQKQVLDTYYGPTKGYGRASKENVKMSTMHVFLKEMAETRSVNRALRLYTGYGGTSYEEMPNSTIEAEVQ